MTAYLDGAEIIQISTDYGQTWEDVAAVAASWDCSVSIYRPKTKPVKRAWSKPEDVPGPVCWLGSSSHQEINGQYLIVSVCVSGVWIMNGERAILKRWKDIAPRTHSTDRKTWAKCEVTEP